MKTLLTITILAFTLLVFSIFLENTKDPNSIGMHDQYSVKCVNGYVYRFYVNGTIRVENSDGTPLKCGHKLY